MSVPIIDTHLHLFDPTRPQGVPWPPRGGAVPCEPMLPAGFRKLAQPLGVVGAIELECSPWFDDNQWVLDIAAGDSIILGMIGNLEPDKPDFGAHIERFHQNPLFLGIRYGNLWERDLGAQLAKPAFVAGLKLLAEAGLVLDTANPNQQLLDDVLRVTDLVPDLRVVLDHLPNMPAPRETVLRELAGRPRVFVKVSGVLQKGSGGVSYDLNSYRPMLDLIWEIFGPDRLLFGSDWPNSAPLGTYAQVLSVVHEYFSVKGEEAAQKYLWKNSLAVYRWKRRAADQPGSDS